MTNKEQLISQHIREYESRLKHIDELYEKAEKATAHLDESHDSHSELQQLASERLKLQQEAGEIKTISVKNWREDTIQASGPMAIWDLLAQHTDIGIHGDHALGVVRAAVVDRQSSPNVDSGDLLAAEFGINVVGQSHDSLGAIDQLLRRHTL